MQNFKSFFWILYGCFSAKQSIPCYCYSCIRRLYLTLRLVCCTWLFSSSPATKTFSALNITFYFDVVQLFENQFPASFMRKVFHRSLQQCDSQISKILSQKTCMSYCAWHIRNAQVCAYVQVLHCHHLKCPLLTSGGVTWCHCRLCDLLFEKCWKVLPKQLSSYHVSHLLRTPATKNAYNASSSSSSIHPFYSSFLYRRTFSKSCFPTHLAHCYCLLSHKTAATFLGLVILRPDLKSLLGSKNDPTAVLTRHKGVETMLYCQSIRLENFRSYSESLLGNQCYNSRYDTSYQSGCTEYFCLLRTLAFTVQHKMRTLRCQKTKAFVSAMQRTKHVQVKRTFSHQCGPFFSTSERQKIFSEFIFSPAVFVHGVSLAGET